jgi:Xaa-Pro aminopeptidase
LVATLVTDPHNVRWLTGLVASSAAVLVRADGSTVIATDDRYSERAEELVHGSADCALVVTREPLKALLQQAAATPSSPVGLDTGHLTYRVLVGAVGDVAWADDGGRIEGLRKVKDEVEVTLMRQACAIADAAVETSTGRLREGMTEREAARIFTDTIVDQGADGPSFPPIVAFGPNTSKPHHVPGDRALVRGDLVLMDVGAAVEGYSSDMTRTFAFGDPGLRLREVHAAVVQAQAVGRARVRDGVAAGDVDAAVREVLVEAGLGEAFTHGTGHGIGLQVHEAPILRTGAPAILGASFTVTVEPGAYLPRIGGVRVEDLVLVGPEEAESLTRLPRDLVVL